MSCGRVERKRGLFCEMGKKVLEKSLVFVLGFAIFACVWGLGTVQGGELCVSDVAVFRWETRHGR